ncbi:MAG: histidine phosphatase family protein, partial [Thermomicrobiales bacterium]
PEQKARQTGDEIAHVLGIPIASDEDLREQGIGTLPYLTDDAFRDAVRTHFKRPDEIVLGQESARDAGERLARAIGKAVARSPETLNPSIVVTHGRVLSSYLSQLTGMDAIAIWESLRMPDALVVDFETGIFRAIR